MPIFRKCIPIDERIFYINDIKEVSVDVIDGDNCHVFEPHHCNSQKERHVIKRSLVLACETANWYMY